MRTLSIAGSLLLAAAAPLAQEGKSWRLGAERDARWREDLRQFADELPKRHKNLFFSLKKEAFEAAVAALEREIPKLRDEEVLVRLMQIVASVGDGHTAVQVGALRPPIRSFPVQFAQVSDGLFVFAAADHREVIGGRVLKIGNLDAKEALARIATALSHDTPAALRFFGPQYASIAEVLFGLGLTRDAGTLNLTVKARDGQEHAVDFEVVEPGARPAMTNYYQLAKVTPPRAIVRRDAYWFEVPEKSKTLYIQYNQCVDAKEKPFADFAKEAVALGEKEGVERVAIDLRRNTGGNSSVIQPLLDGLKASPRLGEKGRLFVLIGAATQSSALMNAIQLRGALGATLVGSPAGQRPNHYGEMRTFELANSGIQVSYSTKLFRMVENDPPALDPDVLIEASSADLLAGRDPALDAVLAGKLPRK